jgi:hypothetical protein
MKNRVRQQLSVQRFEAGTIDPEAFDHEAHVYVGWLYLKAFPRPEAGDRFCAALRRLTVRLGIPDKYHETITRFFLQLIAERYAAAPQDDWRKFRARNDDLCGGAGALLGRHYSPELLASDRARRSFVAPDRRAA